MRLVNDDLGSWGPWRNERMHLKPATDESDNAWAELERLEREGQPATAMRRAKLSDTIEKMEIAYVAFA